MVTIIDEDTNSPILFFEASGGLIQNQGVTSTSDTLPVFRTIGTGSIGFTIKGTVVGSNIGIRFANSNLDPDAFNRLTVSGTGSVFGQTNHGLEISSVNAAVVNRGLIEGEIGIFINDFTNPGNVTNTRIVNFGTITGTEIAGIQVMDANNIKIVNRGSISGPFSGVEARGDDVDIVNFGNITGGSFRGVRLLSDGGSLNNKGLIILNSSTGDKVAVDMSADGGTEAPTLKNSGTISASGGISVRADVVNATVIKNSGTLNGDVTMGNFGDRIVNKHLIVGDIEFFSGNDVLVSNGNTAQITGDVFGGSGNDKLKGGGFSDHFFGGTGDDKLFGQGGDDVLTGDQGKDKLFGGAGSDTLSGGADNDNLFGQDGDDVLTGDQGNDRLFGGEGDDTLSGGDGADRFIFAANSGDDSITDFEDGVDRIDLRKLDVQSEGQLLSAISDIGDDVLINLDALGGNGSIVIEDFFFNDTNAADFLF